MSYNTYGADQCAPLSLNRTLLTLSYQKKKYLQGRTKGEPALSMIGLTKGRKVSYTKFNYVQEIREINFQLIYMQSKKIHKVF